MENQAISLLEILDHNIKILYKKVATLEDLQNIIIRVVLKKRDISETWISAIIEKTNNIITYLVSAERDKEVQFIKSQVRELLTDESFQKQELSISNQ